MKFMTALTAIIFSVTTILAAPVQLAGRDVWVPKILTPNATTLWNVGQTYLVIWSLDQKPVNVTNPIGTVYLSKNGTLDIRA